MAETDRSIAQSLSPTASEEGQEEGADPAVSGGDESSQEVGPAGRDPETGTRAESEGEDEKKIGEEEEDEEREEPEAVALQKDEAGEADKENAVTPRPKEQEGGFHDDDAAGKHGKPESRGNLLSSEAQEAERRAEEVKRCRGDSEREELKRMRQETEAELQELRKRREERRKVLEEAEKQKKREMEERKAREEEEKRQMKEGIERRRAEAAEKRQKADGEAAKPFVCVGPRGSSLKIGDRAEFLNKSAQKSSTLKTSHTPTISKIDNRLEQYTTALQSQREARPSRLALDLPVVTDGIRSLKTRWEEGDVIGNININKESAHVKIAVAELISDWLHRTPETPKSPGAMPADLKPGDVTNKRSLWENMSSAPKTPDGDVSKPVANGKAPV